MHHTNPYIAGPPVSDDTRFQGRRDTIETILRAVRNPNVNSIAVSGPRQIGKSSLLRQLECDLSDQDYIQVFFDLHGKSQLPLERLLYEIAEGIAAALAVRPPASERFDPEGQFFSQSFLPALERRVAPQKIVLLFDEFDVAANLEPGQAGAYFLPFMLQQPVRFRHICFIFAIGRNTGQSALQSRFNLVEKLSRLSYPETELIIRQSEQQQSLYWHKDAVQRIWEWTRGHPFLTQLLCKVIWESLVEAGDPEVPIAEVRDVDDTVGDALSLAGSLFDFIWRSLRPEERQVIASLATSKNGGYTRGELLQLLQRNQVQFDAGALETALRRLSDTDVVQPVDDAGNKFNFSVPLFWYWIAANHAPRVQHDGGTTALPRQQPAAAAPDQPFNDAAEDEIIEPEYISGTEAAASSAAASEEALRNALKQNPNHIQSRIQLARLLLDAGRVQEAANVLQTGPWEQSTEMKDELVTALMARAEHEKGGNQLATYRQILNIDPSHTMARERFENFGAGSQRPVLNHQKMSSSLDILKQPGGDDRRDQHQNTIRDREIAISVRMAEAEEAKENWKAAATIYEQIARKYPDDPAIESRLRHARVQLKLEARYREATDAMRRGDNDTAKQILAEIIMRNPNYKDAPGLLLQATTGINISEIQQRLEAENRQLQSAKAKITYLQNEIQRLRSDEWQNASAIQVAQEQIQKFQEVLREAEGKEKQYERKLADAQLKIQTLQTGGMEEPLGSGQHAPDSSPFGDLFSSGTPAPGNDPAAARRQAEAQQAEAARQRAEAQRRREAEESELRKQQEELQAEAARQREEALRRRQEMEEARRRQLEEQQQAEAARQREEALRRRQEMEEARRRQLEEQQQAEAARQREEALRRRQEMEEARRRQEQEQKQAEAARQREEVLRRRQEMEEARLRQEQEQKQAEAARQREEVLRRRQEVEEARLRQAQEQKQAEATRQREEVQRRRQEMEEARLRQEQEQKQAEATRQREEALRRRQEVEEARLRQEQEQKQAEAARQREEALRRRQEMEEARLRQEQEQKQAPGRQAQPEAPRRKIETAWQRQRAQTPPSPPQGAPASSDTPATPRDASPPGAMPGAPQAPAPAGDRPAPPREPLGPRSTPAWQSRQSGPPAGSRDLPPRRPGFPPPPEEAAATAEPVTPDEAGLRPGARRPLRPVEAKAPSQFTISRSHPAIDAENRRVQMQASWIMGSLLWLPAFIWLLWSWYVSPFAWEKDSRFIILVGVLISWVLCSRYGASNRKEITAIFLYLAPVIAHVIGMDMLSEFRNIALSEFRRVGGVPAFSSENQPLIIIGATVYLLVISMIAALSGEAALAAVLGLLGGAASGAILFIHGGGAIESTFVLTFVVTTTMLLRQTDLGTSTSAGVMVGVPAGFLVFAMTGLVAAENFHSSVLVGFFSYASFLVVAAVVYLLVRMMRRLTRKSPFE